MRLKGGLGNGLRPDDLKGIGPAAIADIILKGVSDTPMPPWDGLLTPAEAEWIARELKKGSWVK